MPEPVGYGHRNKIGDLNRLLANSFISWVAQLCGRLGKRDDGSLIYQQLDTQGKNMANIKCERIDHFVSIRLECGETNVLTMDVLRELSEAIRDAETHGRGLLLCGGDKFFSNGVDLEWALSQSSAQIRAMFLKLG